MHSALFICCSVSQGDIDICNTMSKVIYVYVTNDWSNVEDNYFITCHSDSTGSLYMKGVIHNIFHSLVHYQCLDI